MSGFSMKVALERLSRCTTVEACNREHSHSCDMCCNSAQCLWRNCDTCQYEQAFQYQVEGIEKYNSVAKMA